MIPYFPKYFAKRSVACYMLSLAIVTILFYNKVMPVYLYLFGIISVAAFYYGTSYLTKKWSRYGNRYFEQKLLALAVALRAGYVLFIYYLNNQRYGTYYESNPADIEWYVAAAQELAHYIRIGDWSVFPVYVNRLGVAFDDMGYISYLSLVYVLTGGISSVIIPLLLKALLGAYTCVFTYRIAARHFDEGVARIAGVFCALQFNMIWWCGSMMKETEMVFFTLALLNILDQFIEEKKISSWNIIAAVFLSLLLFAFRISLGLIIVSALMLTLLFASERRVNFVTKTVIVVLTIALLGLSMGSMLRERTAEMAESVLNDNQSVNMEWRAERKGGNSFAKYAGAAVFAPLIFSLPFPTMVYTQPDQEMLMQVGGGNFIKNILSFFVVLSLIILLLRVGWKKHVLPIAFLFGYLLSLVVSEYAQSGRFHMPVIPIEMMLAAYGLSLMNRQNIKWFDWVLVAEIFICIAWSWFKLAGRGLA